MIIIIQKPHKTLERCEDTLSKEPYNFTSLFCGNIFNTVSQRSAVHLYSHFSPSGLSQCVDTANKSWLVCCDIQADPLVSLLLSAHRMDWDHHHGAPFLRMGMGQLWPPQAPSTRATCRAKGNMPPWTFASPSLKRCTLKEAHRALFLFICLLTENWQCQKRRVGGGRDLLTIL